MRLYLSSFRIGGFPERLKEMAGEGGEAIVLANACDTYADREGRSGREGADGSRRARIPQPRARSTATTSAGTTSGGRWLERISSRYAAGSAFVLRKALESSGTDRMLVNTLASDSFVYGGYSAGVCVLGEDISIFDTVDDRVDVERAYGELAREDGLGVIDFIVVPHVDSPGHPETEQCTALSRNLQQNGIEHFALRDDDVVVVDGDQTTLLR